MPILKIFNTAIIALSLIGGAAFAQNDMLANFAKACGQQINQVAKDNNMRKTLNQKYSAMREACSAFRECKRSCRHTKKSCKGDAKKTKKQCIASCEQISDKKERKACKKQCRADKKASKIDCRDTKRSCKEQCRAELMMGECKSARKDFWNAVGSSAEKMVSACAKEFPKKP